MTNANPPAPADDFNARMDRIARMQEESALRQAETDRQMAETRRLIKELAKEVKGFTGGSGECYEVEIAQAVKDAREVAGIKLDAFTVDLRSLQGNQFDLVGVNGKCIVVMEIKTTLGTDDITRFVGKSIPAFKHDFAADIGRKSVKGAIIYRRLGGSIAARRKVAADALSRGIILLRAIGTNALYQIKTPAEVSIPARQLKPAAKSNNGNGGKNNGG